MVAIATRLKPARANAPRPSRPAWLWWLVGVILLSISLLVQLPARWLLTKFAPNTPYLQQVSGNLWHGQANWQIMTAPNTPLAGTVVWQWRPWQVFLGQIGMNVQIQTGKATLDGQASLSKNNWQISGLNGKVAPDTLRQMVNWQLPDVPLLVKDASLGREGQRYTEAKGNLTWAGGELGYPTGGKIYKLTMPATVGTLSLGSGNGNGNSTDKPSGNGTAGNTASNKLGQTPNSGGSNGQKLHLALTNSQAQRLGDLYLDGDNMLDVALTQRLLKTMPDYKGQGVDDTVVVTLRQPLASITK